MRMQNADAAKRPFEDLLQRAHQQMREKGIPVREPERTLIDEMRIGGRRIVKWVLEKLGPVAPFLRAAFDLGVNFLRGKLRLLVARRKQKEVPEPPMEATAAEASPQNVSPQDVSPPSEAPPTTPSPTANAAPAKAKPSVHTPAPNAGVGSALARSTSTSPPEPGAAPAGAMNPAKLLRSVFEAFGSAG
ncbi:MAG: hypothetical protein IPK82_23730 [Polyangiaceae bacterium]|nr:hypothetical protein [Polyangiaceae bacterium]